MYETGEAILFFIVFASQVAWSWFYPRRVVTEMRRTLEKYRPSTHPKLYPLPVEHYERRLRNCGRLNLSIVVAGIVIIAGLILGTFGTDWDGAIVTPWSSSGEWDAAIVTPFFIVQVFGIVYFQLSEQKHNKAMIKAGPPRLRTTELRRRRLSDFISPAELVAAAITYVAFIAFALYYRSFGFPWYTAAGNIAGVTAMNVMMAISVGVVLHTGKTDFYQAHKDRLDMMKVVGRKALLLSIGAPIAITALLLVKLFAGPDFLEPVVTSLYVQGILLVLLWPSYRYRTDKIDFDVYRQDARESSPAAPTTMGSARPSS
jgi:hypothetical protein